MNRHRIARGFALTTLLFASVSDLRAELFVSGFNSHRVYRYNETSGAFLDVFVPNTNNLLNLPHGLAFGPDGNFYVASAGNDCVLRYNGTNGAFLNVFATNSTGALDYPVALIFRPDGLLYVSSQSNDCVVRFNATNGAFVDVFVTNSTALDGPSDMVFGPDGKLYVVGRYNNRVSRYNGANGAFMDSFGVANLSQPFGLRCAADGNLLVVSGNDNVVQRFNGTNGFFLNTFLFGGALAFPIGVEIGPDGNVYAALAITRSRGSVQRTVPISAISSRWAAVASTGQTSCCSARLRLSCRRCWEFPQLAQTSCSRGPRTRPASVLKRLRNSLPTPRGSRSPTPRAWRMVQMS